MPLFTSQNAKEMAARSAAARRERKLREEHARLNPPLLPPPPALEAGDAYVARRLSKVREQISRVDVMFDRCCDPTGLDRIAAVLARLSELERHLSGRPLPGSRRPRPEPTRRVPMPLPLDD